MIDIDIKNDLENLKSLDKDKAIVTTMHLLDAAEQLTNAEPQLALLLTNFANAVMYLTGLTQDDIEQNNAIVEEIRNVENTILRIKDK